VQCLSEFYGIAIYMYFVDHNPPHFHAIYGGHEALVNIITGEILRGALPRTANARWHVSVACVQQGLERYRALHPVGIAGCRVPWER
jgi:hypothetical protein